MADAQVAIIKCGGYERERLYESVDRILRLLGGLERFVLPGEKVLVKPNLLSARAPDEGVTTHPEFIRAVLRHVKKISKNIAIGDSPGGYGKNIDEVFEKCGVKRVAREEGVELVRFNKSKKVGRYPVAACVLEADKVISLPKFKTHDVMLITAAVKNMYGIMPGIAKAEQHNRAPRAKDLAPIIVDVFSARKPDLTITDAIISMDRDGPSRGRLRKTDFMIASCDAVAVDSVLMKIIGKKPFDLYTNEEAHKRGEGTADLNDIEVLGDPVESVKVDGFEFSSVWFLARAPKPVLSLLKCLIRFRIDIDGEKCLRCGLCEESCPAAAITISGKSCGVDRSRCLLCMCCREICPHGAVTVNRSPLARKVWG